MQTSPVFKISPNAIFETFNDEVMVINMVSGSYFAMDQVALGVWEQLQESKSLPRIIEATQQQYQGDPAIIAEAINDLVKELEQEGLIVRAEGDSPANEASSASPSPDNNAERPIFQAPVLNKFTDMQDLLLLDPIHEVDEAGWPHAKAAPTTGDAK